MEIESKSTTAVAKVQTFEEQNYTKFQNNRSCFQNHGNVVILMYFFTFINLFYYCVMLFVMYSVKIAKDNCTGVLIGCFASMMGVLVKQIYEIQRINRDDNYFFILNKVRLKTWVLLIIGFTTFIIIVVLDWLTIALYNNGFEISDENECNGVNTAVGFIRTLITGLVITIAIAIFDESLNQLTDLLDRDSNNIVTKMQIRREFDVFSGFAESALETLRVAEDTKKSKREKNDAEDQQRTKDKLLTEIQNKIQQYTTHIEKLFVIKEDEQKLVEFLQVGQEAFISDTMKFINFLDNMIRVLNCLHQSHLEIADNLLKQINAKETFILMDFKRKAMYLNKQYAEATAKAKADNKRSYSFLLPPV